MEQAAEPGGSPRRWTPRATVVLSIASAAATLPLAIIYWLRPDSCAAITVWPVWAWAIPGLAILLPGIRRGRGRPALLAACVWAVWLVALAEEPKSLLRFNQLDSVEWRTAAREGRAIRVVSLNCAAGTVEAMGEVAPYHPDLVLLQESPTEKQVTDFAHRLFGSDAGIGVGFDPSIVARGSLTPAAQPPDHRAWFVMATVHLPGKPPLDVISLRLTPACVRTDLYSASAWEQHAENRRLRREQLCAVVEALRRKNSGNPVVLAGDFNAQQDDAVFDLLRPTLRDVFKTAGSGWGDTIINEAPVLRIDEIWASPAIRATAVVARRTANSDHRMVVADLILPPMQGTSAPPANPAR